MPTLLLAVSLLALAPLTATPADEALAPSKVRVALRGVARDLAKLGEAEELDALRDVLLQLGEEPKDLERLARGWARDLEKGKENERTRRSVAKKLRAQVDALEGELDALEPPRTEELARILVELDAQSPPANEALGRVERDGAWMTPTALADLENKARVARLTREALAFEVEVSHGQSEHPVVVELYGERARTVSAHGLALHSGIEAKKLERILRQALRAAALSNALLGGEVAVPEKLRGRRFVLMDAEADYERALDEAAAAGAISAEALAEQRASRQRSFADGRGWRTSRWRTEADFEALILWLCLSDWLGQGAQPCLEVGHLNWLCLHMFGTTIPIVNWSETREGRPATRAAEGTVDVETLKRSAQRSLTGCRSWMQLRVRQGKDVPWSRAMVDQFGKIQDEPLLKATMVNELLQERGELQRLVDATRRVEEDRVGAFERALGKPLSEYEDEWARWLLSEAGGARGMLQRIEGAAAAAAQASADALRAAQALNELRAPAFGDVEHERVTLAADLSAAAEAHAAYLQLHADQRSKWPDAHEEYPDREGFTPAGARAGLSSVIHFVPDPVDALEGWMATFYHRLPLLDPGLFGVGYGATADVVVLDVASLVAPALYETWVAWPYDGQRGVPLAFQPELPNPVPGEDQATWGFPITLQLFGSAALGETRLTLELFEGSGDDAPSVPGHFLSPQEPKFEKLAPANAWCFIPRSRLRAGQLYRVRATSPSGELVKSWSFTAGR